MPLAGGVQNAAYNHSVISSGDTIFTAYAVPISGSNEIKVKYYDSSGNAWVDHSTVDSNYESELDFKISSGDTLYIIHGIPFKAVVKKWNGSSWEYIGDSAGISDGEMTYPQLCLQNDNSLYAAYGDTSISNKAVVKKWNGSSWEYIGDSAGISDGSALYISLTTDNNVLYISYRDQNISGKILVKKWNGSSWEYIGDSAGISDGSASYITTEISNDDRLFIGYADSDATASNDIVVLREIPNEIEVSGHPDLYADRTIVDNNGTIQANGINLVEEVNRTIIDNNGTIDIATDSFAHEFIIERNVSGNIQVDGEAVSFYEHVYHANGTIQVSGEQQLDFFDIIATVQSGTIQVTETTDNESFSLSYAGNGTIDIDGTQETQIEHTPFDGNGTIDINGTITTEIYRVINPAQGTISVNGTSFYLMLISTIYVDTDVVGGNHNGTTWDNAYSTIYDALTSQAVDFSIFNEPKHFYVRASNGTPDTTRIDTSLYSNSTSTAHIIIESVDDHNGVFDSGGYKNTFLASGDTSVVNITEDYTEIKNVELQNTLSFSQNVFDVQAKHVVIDTCIFKNTNPSLINGRPLHIESIGDTYSVVVANSLFVGGVYNIIEGVNSTTYPFVRLYNSTFVSQSTGLYFNNYYDAVVANCYVGNANTDISTDSGTLVLESTYTEDGSVSTPTAAFSETTEARFLDIDTDDYRIAWASSLKGVGIDLSGDSVYPIAQDVEGQQRINWDVGFDEASPIYESTVSISIDGTYSRYLEIDYIGTGTIQVTEDIDSEAFELSYAGNGTIDIDGLAGTELGFIPSTNGTIDIDGLSGTELGFIPSTNGTIDIDGTYTRYLEIDYTGTGTIQVTEDIDSESFILDYAGNGTIQVNGTQKSQREYNPFTSTGTINIDGISNSSVGFTPSVNGTVNIDGLSTFTYTNDFLYTFTDTILTYGAAETIGGYRWISSGTIQVNGTQKSQREYNPFTSTGTINIDGLSGTEPGFAPSANGTINIDGTYSRYLEIDYEASGAFTITTQGTSAYDQFLTYNGNGTITVDGELHPSIDFVYIPEHAVSILIDGTHSTQIDFTLSEALVAIQISGIAEYAFSLTYIGNGTILLNGSIDTAVEFTQNGNGTILIDGAHFTQIDFPDHETVITINTNGAPFYQQGYELDGTVDIDTSGEIIHPDIIFSRTSRGIIDIDGDWIRYIDYSDFPANGTVITSAQIHTEYENYLNVVGLDFSPRSSDVQYFNYKDFWGGKIK